MVAKGKRNSSNQTHVIYNKLPPKKRYLRLHNSPNKSTLRADVVSTLAPSKQARVTYKTASPCEVLDITEDVKQESQRLAKFLFWFAEQNPQC